MLICLQDTVAVHHHMEVEAEAMAAVTEVAVTGIHLDLEASLPGGRCHHRTLGATFPNKPREKCSCTNQSWRLAGVLDHFTIFPTLLATALDFPFFTKPLPMMAFSPLTVRHAGLGIAKPYQRPPQGNVETVHQHVS